MKSLKEGKQVKARKIGPVGRSPQGALHQTPGAVVPACADTNTGQHCGFCRVRNGGSNLRGHIFAITHAHDSGKARTLGVRGEGLLT